MLNPVTSSRSRVQKTYNAWGFVRLNLAPQYVALYITHPARAIQFLGEVEAVVEANAPQSPVQENYREFEVVCAWQEGDCIEAWEIVGAG